VVQELEWKKPVIFKGTSHSARKGDLPPALQNAQEIVVQYPDDAASWDQMGNLNGAMLNLPKARDSFAHVLKLDPEYLSVKEGLQQDKFSELKTHLIDYIFYYLGVYYARVPKITKQSYRLSSQRELPKSNFVYSFYSVFSFFICFI